MIVLDVGLWLAAAWGRHIHHPAAAGWLDQQEDDLVLCRVTQMSLLRLLSNPAIMGQDVVSRAAASRMIDQFRADERVVWAAEPAHLEAVADGLRQGRDQPQALDR